MLDLFQIKNGKFRKNEEIFDIRESVQLLLDMFKISTDEKGIDLKFNCDDSVPLKVNTDQ